MLPQKAPPPRTRADGSWRSTAGPQAAGVPMPGERARSDLAGHARLPKPDRQIDVLEVGEEVLVETAQSQERLPIERRGATAGTERRRGSIGRRVGLAVEVVVGDQRPIDLHAGAVDRPVREAQAAGHRVGARALADADELLQEALVGLGVVVEQTDLRRGARASAGVDRRPEAAVDLELDEPDVRMLGGEHLAASVDGAVVDHADGGLDRLPAQRVEREAQPLAALVMRDQDLAAVTPLPP